MNVGDTVVVKGTKHKTTIKRKSGVWFILKRKEPKVCCNYYSESQLEVIK